MLIELEPFRKLVKLVSTRSSEALLRPALVSALRSALVEAAEFAYGAKANTTNSLSLAEVPHYTLVELGLLENLTIDATRWFEKTLALQDAVKPFEDPVLRVSEMEKRLNNIGSEMSKLRKKKAPRKKLNLPKKKVKATVVSSADEAEATVPVAPEEATPEEVVAEDPLKPSVESEQAETPEPVENVPEQELPVIEPVVPVEAEPEVETPKAERTKDEL